MDGRRVCSVARTLDVIGERWSLLVLREVFLGVRRFESIREATGAPRAVLADRLRSLVDAGVLVRREYREDGARTRHEYRLTEAGRELQPALTALMQWGDKYLPVPGGPPLIVEHADRKSTRLNSSHRTTSYAVFCLKKKKKNKKQYYIQKKKTKKKNTKQKTK